MSRGRSKFIRALGHAVDGISDALRRERHMQFHFAMTLLVILLASYFRVAANEWLWLLTAITVVWIAELFNTAIERAVDLASPELHPLAKAAKDIAAGGVLVAALFSVVVGLIILGPPLWNAIL